MPWESPFDSYFSLDALARRQQKKRSNLLALLASIST
jgi:hypothetical protein